MSNWQDFSTLPISREDARAQGSKSFFTGKPCVHGHIAPRYTSTTNCVECQAAHARRAGGWTARPPTGARLQIVRKAIESRGGSLLSTEYVSAKSKLKVRCAQGHEFEATADNLKRKRWCPVCKHAGHSKRMEAGFRAIEDLKAFARDRHDGDCLATSPVGMNTHVLWRCAIPAHKPFPATPAHVVSSGSWCPECDAERRRLRPPKPQIPRDEVEKVVERRGGEVVQVYGDRGWAGLGTRLRVRCEYLHEWDVAADNLMHAGSWCPHCRNKGERITRAIFEATFSGCKFPKVKPDWLASATGRKLELDGYCEIMRLAFEYQGYHHKRDDVKATDALKLEACRNHGVELIEIIALDLKRPFPPKNVLELVAAAFRASGREETPVLPAVEAFAPELTALRDLARVRGGELVSTVYCGSEPHEWKCDQPGHPTWRAEPWRIKAGSWCPSCAGNRPLGIEGLLDWGLACGLELLDTQYQGTSAVYEWRCKELGHLVKRSKGNIQQSLTKGLPACNICGPGISANVLSRKSIADKFAAEVLPLIDALKAEGHTSLEALASQLNEQKVPTPRGTRWYASSVRNLMSRVYKG